MEIRNILHFLLLNPKASDFRVFLLKNLLKRIRSEKVCFVILHYYGAYEGLCGLIYFSLDSKQYNRSVRVVQ